MIAAIVKGFVIAAMLSLGAACSEAPDCSGAEIDCGGATCDAETEFCERYTSGFEEEADSFSCVPLGSCDAGDCECLVSQYDGGEEASCSFDEAACGTFISVAGS